MQSQVLGDFLFFDPVCLPKFQEGREPNRNRSNGTGLNRKWAEPDEPRTGRNRLNREPPEPRTV